jgi:hypothetical protein
MTICSDWPATTADEPEVWDDVVSEGTDFEAAIRYLAKEASRQGKRKTCKALLCCIKENHDELRG